MIISFNIPPGTKLSPVRIAELLNISRTPVAEALTALREMGLVVTREGKQGYYVFDLSHASLRNLFEARKALEGTAAFLCAQRNREIDLPMLERLAKLFSVSFEKKYFNRFSAIDQAFHLQIIQSCGNPLLLKMYMSIDKLNKYYSIRSQEYMMSIGNEPDFRAVAGQHLSIYRAIELGMPELAEQASKTHLDAGYSLAARYHLTVGNLL